MANNDEKNKLELELFTLYKLYDNHSRLNTIFLSLSNAYRKFLIEISSAYVRIIKEAVYGALKDCKLEEEIEYEYESLEEKGEVIKLLKNKIKTNLKTLFSKEQCHKLHKHPVDIIINDESIFEKISVECSCFVEFQAKPIIEKKHFFRKAKVSNKCKGTYSFYHLHQIFTYDFKDKEFNDWIARYFPKELFVPLGLSKNLDENVHYQFSLLHHILTDVSHLFSRDNVTIVLNDLTKEYIKSFNENDDYPSNVSSATLISRVLSKKDSFNYDDLIHIDNLPDLYIKKCVVIPSFYASSEDAIQKMCFLYINKRADNIKDLINLYETEKWREKVLDKLDIQNNLLNEVGKAMVASLNSVQNSIKKHTSTIEKQMVNISKQISELPSHVSTDSNTGLVLAKLEAIRTELL